MTKSSPKSDRHRMLKGFQRIFGGNGYCYYGGNGHYPIRILLGLDTNLCNCSRTHK